MFCNRKESYFFTCAGNNTSPTLSHKALSRNNCGPGPANKFDLAGIKSSGDGDYLGCASCKKSAENEDS
jgi:hypothetical protein